MDDIRGLTIFADFCWGNVLVVVSDQQPFTAATDHYSERRETWGSGRCPQIVWSGQMLLQPCIGRHQATSVHWRTQSSKGEICKIYGNCVSFLAFVAQELPEICWKYLPSWILNKNHKAKGWRAWFLQPSLQGLQASGGSGAGAAIPGLSLPPTVTPSGALHPRCTRRCTLHSALTKGAHSRPKLDKVLQKHTHFTLGVPVTSSATEPCLAGNSLRNPFEALAVTCSLNKIPGDLNASFRKPALLCYGVCSVGEPNARESLPCTEAPVAARHSATHRYSRRHRLTGTATRPADNLLERNLESTWRLPGACARGTAPPLLRSILAKRYPTPTACCLPYGPTVPDHWQFSVQGFLSSSIAPLGQLRSWLPALPRTLRP